MFRWRVLAVFHSECALKEMYSISPYYEGCASTIPVNGVVWRFATLSPFCCLFVCLFSYSTFQKVYLNFLKEKRQYNMMYLYIGYVNHCLTNTSYNWFQISLIFWTQINFLCKSPSGLIDFFEVLIKQSQLYWEFFFIYHVTSQIQKCVI